MLLRDLRSSGEKLSLLSISKKFWENQNNFLKISLWSISFIKFSICLNVVSDGYQFEATEPKKEEIGSYHKEEPKVIQKQRQVKAQLVDSSYQRRHVARAKIGKIKYLKLSKDLSIVYLPSEVENLCNRQFL